LIMVKLLMVNRLRDISLKNVEQLPTTTPIQLSRAVMIKSNVNCN
jgi:hypothetical protein